MKFSFVLIVSVLIGTRRMGISNPTTNREYSSASQRPRYAQHLWGLLRHGLPPLHSHQHFWGWRIPNDQLHKLFLDGVVSWRDRGDTPESPLRSPGLWQRGNDERGDHTRHAAPYLARNLDALIRTSQTEDSSIAGQQQVSFIS